MRWWLAIFVSVIFNEYIKSELINNYLNKMESDKESMKDKVNGATQSYKTLSCINGQTAFDVCLNKCCAFK